MSCPRCGSNLVNYSSPPQCGGCGYELPATGIRVLTEAEALKKYPHIFGVSAPLQPPPSTVTVPDEPIGQALARAHARSPDMVAVEGVLMHAGPNKNGDAFDMGAMMKGLELGTTVQGALERVLTPDELSYIADILDRTLPRDSAYTTSSLEEQSALRRLFTVLGRHPMFEIL